MGNHRSRGLDEYVEGTDYSKVTPIGCIGPDVYFDLPSATIIDTAGDGSGTDQKICAEEITAMMKLTKVEASTPDGNVGEATVFDYSYSAVEFPLWKVAIGETSTYTVPNGYCYANACFDDFAKVGMQSTFK